MDDRRPLLPVDPGTPTLQRTATADPRYFQEDADPELYATSNAMGFWSAPSISKCRRKPSTGSRIVVTSSGSRLPGFASGAWIIASSLMVSLRPGQGLFIKADQTDRQDQSDAIDGLFSSALSFSVRISENRPIIPIAAEPEQILRIAKSGVDQNSQTCLL